MYGYDNAYSDQGGDYGMPDVSNGTGPTGIPDPGNPGYDTAGYPLPEGRTEPPEKTHGGTNVPPPTAPVEPPTAPAPGPEPVNLSGGALAPFDEPAPAIPNIPAYVGSKFTTPTMEEALNDPGARARWQRGQESLQNWAAARGTLNDTDTAKMLLDYGQNSEAQDYGNVYARNFGTWQANENEHQQEYGINRQTQYIDPWTAAYNEWVQRGNFYLNNQGTVANTALGFARL